MKNKKINRNVNKIMTLTMAGAVALSTPLSLVYAAPDANEQHEYIDIHGVCDICGESKENGNHFIDEIIEDDEIIIDDTESTETTETTENTETIIDTETSESTETESTETTEQPEEKNLKNFTFYIKGAKTATDEDLKNIYNKLKTDGKYTIGYGGGNTEENLGVKVNIYNSNDEKIDTFIIYNGDEIIKNLPDKDSGGYMQFYCKPELVAENLHYTKDGDCFMYSSIKTEDGEIPVLKFFIFDMCWDHSNYKKSEEPIHIINECIMVCNYNDPDFDLDEFLQDEEIHKFFYRDIVHDKGCICRPSGKPPVPPTTEEPSTETPSTEEPSTETPSTEEPSTETPSTEEPSTETPSTEEPSTEIPSTEEPSTEIPSTEEPSTETPSTEEPSTETPSTEEPSTEIPSTEEPSTEIPSTEEPSTETPSTEEPSTEEPSTEEPPSTEENKTPEPVKPVEPDKKEETTTTITPTPEPNKTEETITPTPQPITEDRGKVDPSETENEMVQTGDMATHTYYGSYFLVAGIGALTAFFKKFKK